MRRVDIQSNNRVLIVDDNYDHATGIRELINLESCFEVIGSAANAKIALSLIKQYRPDVVLMDINMPDIDGITAISQIKEIDENVKVIALTGYDDSDLIYRTMKAGARGYILKTMASSQLIYAIEEVANGKICLPTSLSTRFFEHFQKAVHEADTCRCDDSENLLSYLTQREFEVLELLTQGVTYKGVSKQLFISETTVKTHVNNIFQKLQVNDRTQAVLYAINHGINKRSGIKAAV